jgi:hypothetical protein
MAFIAVAPLPGRFAFAQGGRNGRHFQSISAGMRIERLAGPYTRVNITLVHETSNMLFYLLLPEVVGGTMQPGDVVNPIRRILPQCKVIGGRLDEVDAVARQVTVRCHHGALLTLGYDQLILAPFLQPNLNPELADDPAERARLLTIAVI